MGKEIVSVSDQLNKQWVLFDAKNKKWSSNEAGYYQFSCNLYRNWQYAWRDFALNNLLTLTLPPNRILWQGRLETIELIYNKKKPYVAIGASGYQSHLSDKYINGSIPAGTWESQLQWLIANGYLPYLQAIYTYMYNSGMSNLTTLTGNGGTDDISIAKMIEKILTGNLSDGSKIQYQIWNDRILQTVKVLPPSLSTATYRVELNQVKSLGLRRNLLKVENIVRTRYKDVEGLVQRIDIPDTTSQKALGKNFGSGLINFVRMHLQDITNLKNQTSTSATNAATRLLAQTKAVKNDSKNIVLEKNTRVFEVATKKWIYAQEMKTATYLEVVNLFPLLAMGTGTNAGDSALVPRFYMTKIDCNESGEVTITPEASSDIEDVVE